MDVPGCDGLDVEVLGEVAQLTVASRVTPLERPLELDVEAVATKRLCEPGGRNRISQAESLARAAGETDEALVPFDDAFE